MEAMLYPENIPLRLEVLLIALDIELKALPGVAPSPLCRRLKSPDSLRKMPEADTSAVKAMIK
jgi:hypothetical protein